MKRLFFCLLVCLGALLPASAMRTYWWDFSFALQADFNREWGDAGSLGFSIADAQYFWDYGGFYETFDLLSAPSSDEDDLRVNVMAGPSLQLPITDGLDFFAALGPAFNTSVYQGSQDYGEVQIGLGGVVGVRWYGTYGFGLNAGLKGACSFYHDADYRDASVPAGWIQGFVGVSVGLGAWDEDVYDDGVVYY